MSVRERLAPVVGAPDDRARPLRLLLGLSVLLSAPTVLSALVLLGSDLREDQGQAEGLGIVIGAVLLVWTGLVVLLCAAALRLRERRTASAVLGVLGGLATLWVSTVALAWWPGLPPVLSVPLTWLCVGLGLVAVALGVVAARR